MTEKIDAHSLSETLIYEITKALALPQTRFSKRLVQLIFGKAARRTAEVAMGLDEAIAEGGIHGGARWLLPKFAKSHEARGLENIPAIGPLVIASNHPASIDSVVISAYVQRHDYKVIIGDIAFFENLPHARDNAIFAPDHENTSGRMQVVRESIRHLKSGGALLIFPHGNIEPDPEFMPNPDESFHLWSRSLEIFMNRVPGLEVLVTIVSGVISQKAYRHPITWFRKERPDKQRLAFMYQIARQMLAGKELFGLAPRVTFGEVIKSNDHPHALTEIESAACRTLQKHLEWNQSLKQPEAAERIVGTLP